MKVDPNQPIEFTAECVLCEAGQVVLYDGSITAMEQLDQEGNAFKKFCQSLDPNKCFIMGIIPDDADRDVFFKAREVASKIGMHMQALVDTPENHRSRWESYKKMKNYSASQEESR